MKKKITRTFIISLSAIIFAGELSAQDTFSICAVDSVTGEVGSAGATCIESSLYSAFIISDVHPGVGVVHTQAQWDAGNQSYAGYLMNLGYSPQQIIDTVTAYDIAGNPTIRQYGAVDLNNGSPRSAGFTGVNCMNYKNHILGPGYAIQGNILQGQHILDSMQSRFLNTQGTLACKLMAALQGAKVVGADTRCTDDTISSYSAFIRVARLQDTLGTYILDLTVNTFPAHIEPIDTLQAMLNNLGGCYFTSVAGPSLTNSFSFNAFPNPVTDRLTVIRSQSSNTQVVSVYNITGRKMYESKFVHGMNTINIDVRNFPAGIYSVNVWSAYHKTSITKKIIVQEK